MKTLSIRAFALTVVAVSAIGVPGCKKDNSTTTGYEISLASKSGYGQYLVDKDGYTLYIFAEDSNGRTSCTGSCELTWPYFSVSDLSADKLGPGLDIADFDTIHVNGIAQLRYKSWPLYYYAPGTGSYGENIRELAGQIKGEGFSGVWFVARPDYAIMLEHAQLIGADGKEYTGNYTPGTSKTVYFTDGRGRTLYTFSKDSAGQNTFTKSDFSNNSIWSIYENDDQLFQVPSTLDRSLFLTISVFGRTQLTYKGWPLYYYGLDNSRGNTKGVSFQSPGIWPVAVKDLPDPPVQAGYWDY
jgi:predicted lipoprotein with Yx(FWY)xxD motif